MLVNKEHETPDENLNYSELKDRIRAECARSLPAKERVLWQRSLKEYKQQKKRRVTEESTGRLANSAANADKNVPEVNDCGY